MCARARLMIRIQKGCAYAYGRQTKRAAAPMPWTQAGGGRTIDRGPTTLEPDGLCFASNERQRIHADAYAHTRPPAR